jgi:molybdate transport system substrate-binding protein
MLSDSIIHRFVTLLSLVVLGILSGCDSSNTASQITVFSAASLTDAIEQLADQYTRETGTHVNLHLSSSGMLARQILSGAPADIFISANVQWMDDVEGKGYLIDSTRRVFVSNRLVLIASKNYEGSVTKLDELPDLASSGLAIGDTGHVPAGIYARQALETAGIWDDLQENLIQAFDVRAALAYVENGACSLGIVYKSDALISDEVTVIFEFPEQLHDPIIYCCGIVTGGKSLLSEGFLRFISSPEAYRLLNKLGFDKPDSELHR